jgi:tocopherol O-methyltransferase
VSRQVRSTWTRISWTFLGKLILRPRYLRFLMDKHARNRVFAIIILRLWLAYRTGAMRYGIFTLTRE